MCPPALVAVHVYVFHWELQSVLKIHSPRGEHFCAPSLSDLVTFGMIENIALCLLCSHNSLGFLAILSFLLLRYASAQPLGPPLGILTILFL